MWLVGGRERGGDGLALLISAYTAHDRDPQVCKALVWLLCSACKPERVGLIISAELPLRLSQDAAFCAFMCDSLPAFGQNYRYA